MRAKLVHMIPELSLIGDASLRQQTEDVWLEALRRGGWTVEDLTRMPYSLSAASTSVSMLDHLRGVVGVCVAVADVFAEIYNGKIPINRDVLLAGALLHDVGKLLEYREENGRFVRSRLGQLLQHPVSGAVICAELGLPDEVTHMVAVHTAPSEAGLRTPEAVILHHADFTNLETLH